MHVGTLAERYFDDDPGTAIFKLRQFAELLCKTVAAHHALYIGDRSETFEGTLKRLSHERVIPPEIRDLFHALRKVGNRAAHEVRATHSDALSALKFARQLGIWFHRTYGKQPGFNPGPFVPPSRVNLVAALEEQIKRLRQTVAESEAVANHARQQAEETARAREQAEDNLKREAEERAIWEQIAQKMEAEKELLNQPRLFASRQSRELPEAEKQKAGRYFYDDLIARRFPGPDPLAAVEAARLDALQNAAERAPKSEILDLVARGKRAAARVDMDQPARRDLLKTMTYWSRFRTGLRFAGKRRNGSPVKSV